MSKHHNPRAKEIQANFIRSGEGLSMASGRWRKQLYVVEGLTVTAALISVGLPVVGVPSASDGRILLVAYCRRVLPVEVVILADVDGPGIDGADPLAVALMIEAPVKVAGPATGYKDARALVCAGADRLMIESADVVAMRSTVMQGVSNE